MRRSRDIVHRFCTCFFLPQNKVFFNFHKNKTTKTCTFARHTFDKNKTNKHVHGVGPVFYTTHPKILENFDLQTHTNTPTLHSFLRDIVHCFVPSICLLTYVRTYDQKNQTNKNQQLPWQENRRSRDIVHRFVLSLLFLKPKFGTFAFTRHCPYFCTCFLTTTTNTTPATQPPQHNQILNTKFWFH